MGRARRTTNVSTGGPLIVVIEEAPVELDVAPDPQLEAAVRGFQDETVLARAHLCAGLLLLGLGLFLELRLALEDAQALIDVLDRRSLRGLGVLGRRLLGQRRG
jgi:hypothetical protein